MKEAIVLLNMGGPNSLDEVEMFLSNMFNDKHILSMPKIIRKFVAALIVKLRKNKAKEIYEKLGGRSPLVELTEELVNSLSSRLDGVVVTFAMRYTPPFAKSAIEKLKENKIDRVYLIPLYPQHSTTTTLSSFEDFEESLKYEMLNIEVKKLEHFYRNELFNKTIVERIREALGRDDAKVFDLVFSAHGLPQKVINRGDNYESHVKENMQIASEMLLREGIVFNSVHLAYQSKVGPMKWLEPSLEDKLSEIKNNSVIVYPIAFSIDNSETDYELSIEYAHIAHNLGFENYRVAKAPNSHPLFIETLVSLYNSMKSS